MPALIKPSAASKPVESLIGFRSYKKHFQLLYNLHQLDFIVCKLCNLASPAHFYCAFLYCITCHKMAPTINLNDTDLSIQIELSPVFCLDDVSVLGGSSTKGMLTPFHNFERKHFVNKRVQFYDDMNS